MNLLEAKTECERWLTYLKKQEERALALGKLASDRRAGICDDRQVLRRMAAIDNSVTVYDGAELAKAVRFLLKHVGE